MEEMKIIWRRHDKSDQNAFFLFATCSNIKYYVYSFGFHFTPSATTISQWQNCLPQDSIITEDECKFDVFKAAYPHVDTDQHEYLLPFFGDNKFIERYILLNPTSTIKDDYYAVKDVAKTKQLHDVPIVYKLHFDDHLTTWNEDHFTLRLYKNILLCQKSSQNIRRVSVGTSVMTKSQNSLCSMGLQT